MSCLVDLQHMGLMNDKEKVSLGKFISMILRHRPRSIGITLDEHG